MANSKLNEWKPIIYTVGGLLIASQLSRINIFGGPKGTNTEHVVDPYQGHIDTIKDNAPDQSNLSFPRQVYKNIANVQYESMNGAGTDESTLFDSLKGLNKDDLLTVYMDFGMRAPTIMGGSFAVGGRRNLLEWYRSDLSGNKLKRMLDIWKKTGLTHSY